MISGRSGPKEPWKLTPALRGKIPLIALCYGMYAISKGWHGVRQIPMKGSYNFLAVDEQFHPWLLLIRSCSEDLPQKIPELIGESQPAWRASGDKSGTIRSVDRVV